MPAPPENVNAVKHGLRSKRHGLVHAKLGKRFATAYGDVCRLRRELERLLAEKHGGLTFLQRARVQTVVRLEEGIRACERMIRNHQDMGPEEIRQQRHAIAQWTCQRDNLLSALLGDGGTDGDPFASLYATPPPAAPQPSVVSDGTGPTDAAETPPEDAEDTDSGSA